MPSYVVRLDDEDICQLLRQWEQWGCDFRLLEPGDSAPALGTDFSQPTVYCRKDIIEEWTPEWKRLRWLYYCDDYEGVTLRLYDDKHFDRYAPKGYYIENPKPGSDEHFERVIVRGYSMGSLPTKEAAPGLNVCRWLHGKMVGLAGVKSGDVAELLRDTSVNTLKLRIRAASNWLIWKAGTAPDTVTADNPHHNVNTADRSIRLNYFQDAKRNGEHRSNIFEEIRRQKAEKERRANTQSEPEKPDLSEDEMA